MLEIALTARAAHSAPADIAINARKATRCVVPEKADILSFPRRLESIIALPVSFREYSGCAGFHRPQGTRRGNDATFTLRNFSPIATSGYLVL